MATQEAQYMSWTFCIMAPDVEMPDAYRLFSRYVLPLATNPVTQVKNVHISSANLYLRAIRSFAAN